LHSVKSEESDLTCFEHPMQLAFPSNSSQAVVSQHSELLPHDPVIPDDFLDAESQNDGPQNSDTGPQLEVPVRMKYQQQIVDSYAKLEPQLVVPRTRDEHLDLINSRKMSKSLPDLTSNVTTMMLIPTNLFQCDSALENAFNSVISPVKFVEHPVGDALPTAVPKPTASTDTVAATIVNTDVSTSVPDSLSIPSLNNTNHLSKSDTSAFCTPLKSTTPNFEFTGEEIKQEPSTLNPVNGPENRSADSSGNNSALNCDSHSSSLEAAASVGMQQSSRHNILVSPLTPPFTPAYYSSYFISNCPPGSRTVTTQQSKPSYTVYNISPIQINSPWPFVNNSNPMLCSVVSSPRPQPNLSQPAQNASSEGFSYPQQPLLSSTLSRNPPGNKGNNRMSPVGSSVRKNLFLSTNIDGRRPQPIAPKATLGSIMGYSKKEQVEMLRTYPPRISRKRVRQNDSEEDGAWNEDSPAKRMHRLVKLIFLDHTFVHQAGCTCLHVLYSDIQVVKIFLSTFNP